MNGYLFPELAPPPPPLPTPAELQRCVDGWPSGPPSLDPRGLHQQLRQACEADRQLDNLGRAIAARDPDDVPAEMAAALVKGFEQRQRWVNQVREFTSLWMDELRPTAEPLIEIRDKGLWRAEARSFAAYLRQRWNDTKGDLLPMIEVYEYFARLEGNR